VAKLRITYNAPVVLTFALLAVIVQLLPESVKLDWFVAQPTLEHSVHGYVRLVSYVLGHANWQHLLGNFMLILLIGPILEERHGSLRLLGMIVVTALVTGVVYMMFSSGALLGASGVAFMMILLASTANIRAGEIPLTFIAVVVLYCGAEITQMFKNDNVAHGAHLIGGAVGAMFGFLGAGSRKVKAKPGIKPAAVLAPSKALDKVVGE
jgi:membrane associated rhomboid family serine protease